MLPEIFAFAEDKYSTFTEPVAAPIFRKSFDFAKGSKAKLTIGATGFYDLYLNGQKITKGHLAPFVSNPEQIIFYDEYDLSETLVNGTNVLGVMLGNGFANPIGGGIWNHNRNCHAPSFALEFKSQNVCFGAEDMKWSYSHILFDDLRLGTYCDMTKEQKGWCAPGFNDKGWQKPLTIGYPNSEKRLAECEPVREIRRVEPLSFRPGALRDYRIRDPFADMLYTGDTIMGKTSVSGGYIYDFGENCAGVPLLKIKGKPGQKIEMQFCELMYEGFADYINIDVYPDGCCQKDVYICKGDGEETYIPPFTYHGFRYCYVYGITEEQATKELITYIVLHNDVEVRGEFSCSDEISNSIFDACRRSDEANLFYIVTDCPAREKNGWTGDAAISAEHYLMNLGVEKCFADWLSCIRRAQLSDGSLPLLVPCLKDSRSECPVWDSVLFYLPYYTYIYTGDKQIIKDNKDAFMKNLKFCLSLKDERGITEKGFGDWLPVDMPAGEYHSPLGFCVGAILMEMCTMAEFMLSVIGEKDDADFCKREWARLREALREEYNDNGVITPGKTKKYVKPGYRVCQTSQVLGLHCGLFEEAEKENAVNTLIGLIEENEGSFDCGFLGLRYIFRVLSDNGYTDLAYKMITKPSYPSYGNMIYRGETTVWERFAKPGERIGSHNHHFMADVSAWYIKYLGGINVNPTRDNPDEIYVNPHFLDSLDRVNASYKTPNGKIYVSWERIDGKISVRVKTEGSARAILSPQISNAQIQ